MKRFMAHRAMPAEGTHIWVIRIGDGTTDRDCELSLLSAQEQARAHRFWTGPLRNKYVATHAAVRQILGLYLDLPPQRVPIGCSPTGKPVLEGPRMAFNISHAGAFALCAVASSGQIGVDLEARRAIDDADQIVQRYFTIAEATEYRRCPRSSRLDVFFRIWTRKEALLKGTGEGLRRAGNSVDVRTVDRPGDIVRLDGPGGVEAWWLHSFTPSPGYFGAVARDRLIGPLEFFDWCTVPDADSFHPPLAAGAEARLH